MEPKFFSSQNEFRKWLEKHHEKESEVEVGFWKVATGRPTMTWSESVDQALCFGWIDGVRHSLGEDAYTIRFSPRRSGSNWSAINIAKVAHLTAKGLMHAAGLAAFEKRRLDRPPESNKDGPSEFSPEIAALFKKNNKAWEFFLSLPPGYRGNCTRWVMSGKQESTKNNRLAKLIDACSKGTRIPW
ncbi:MAG TPA: YdeI/OmpD-associated family protein [Pyrinomonadaceae bacterium]|nr:YdeI/OmpD-associated family protein [Pyrinomonadaceae bacterium]